MWRTVSSWLVFSMIRVLARTAYQGCAKDIDECAMDRHKVCGPLLKSWSLRIMRVLRSATHLRIASTSKAHTPASKCANEKPRRLIQRPQILFRCLPGFRDLQSVFDVKVRQRFLTHAGAPFTNGFCSRAVLKPEKPRTENRDASVRTLMSAVN